MFWFLGWPTFIAGLILLAAGAHWFQGAHAVGVILTTVGATIIALAIVCVACALVVAGRRSRSRRHW